MPVGCFHKATAAAAQQAQALAEMEIARLAEHVEQSRTGLGARRRREAPHERGNQARRAVGSSTGLECGGAAAMQRGQ